MLMEYLISIFIENKKVTHQHKNNKITIDIGNVFLEARILDK